MTEEAGRQRHPHPSPKSVRFVELSEQVLAALLDRDLAVASAAAGVSLTGYYITPEALKLWRIRAAQIAADPQSARWIARAAVAEPEGIVVGHAGFHGPPDAAGMVEVAYSVDPARRRAAAVLSRLEREADAVVVHFDVDVLDTGAFPLANFPHFAGLTLEEAAACLGIFCRSGKLADLVVTEVNPDHDPDAILVPALIDMVCDALRPTGG